MKTVQLPGGGSAEFLERGTDEIPGRAVKLIRAAALAASTALADYPQLFEGPQPGETDEQRSVRLQDQLKGMILSTEQAMAWDNLREATAVAMLHAWTLRNPDNSPRPLPTLQTIGDLPEAVYDALLDAVGGVSATDLETDFGPTPASVGDSPFENSNGSKPPSEATPSPDVGQVGAPSTSTASSVSVA